MLLVYGTTTDCCILISCPETLLNLFIILILFWWDLLDFLCMSSANSNGFTSSFLIWIPFISFSCSITLARMFTTMLNKSGVSTHHCLVSDLRGKAFRFSQLNVMLAVGFSCMTFIMLRNFPSFPNFWEFLLWQGSLFCQTLVLLHLLRWSYDFNPLFC